jgi:hypothetical protein
VRRFAVAVALAVALGGCGGGAEFTAPRIPAVTGNAQPGQNAKTLARVTIDWGHGRTSHSVRPRFISPSAQSLSVSVNGGPPQIADAPPHKNGQTTTLTIDAPAGTDLFEFDLWDRDGAMGNLLGTARVTRSIVADQANVVNAMLDGVCAQIALAPAAGQPLLETSYRAGTGPPGQPLYTFVGTSPETIGMTPLDADGNPILGTVPSIALAQAGTNLGGPAVVAISTSGNVATVRPTGEFPRGTTGTLVASSPQCSSTATVGFETSPAIYGVFTGALPSGVQAFDRNGASLALGPLASYPEGIWSESGLDVFSDIFADPVTGNIFGTGSSLAAFTPAGTAITAQGAFATNLTGPIDGTVDTSNGHIYVLYGGGSKGSAREIGEFDREGKSIACDSVCPPALAGGIRLQYDGANRQVCLMTSLKFAFGAAISCLANGGGVPLDYLYSDFAIGASEFALGSSGLLPNSPAGLYVNPAPFPRFAGVVPFSTDSISAVAIDNDDGDVYASTRSNRILAFDPSGTALTATLGTLGVTYYGLAIVSPGPSAVLAVPSILAFTASGQAQPVTVTDASSVNVAERDTCAGIAKITSGASAGQYQVTASAAGSCVITFTDALGALTQVTVGVTITHLTGQGTRRGS